jgi:serine/threonine protein kinase
MSDHPFAAPSPESLAELLPQFDVEFFIAQGGMGAVYKGRQISLSRDIAIKVLPHEVGENEEFRESFISEAKSMARLNHPNLLGVFDYGTVGGMPYIVMEYVDGGSLHQAAYNQAVEPMQAAAIVKGICEGLAHAHEHGIVHRDIKPSNILLTRKAEPKVADFGLAHAADSDTPGLVMGTPGYTAREVFQDPNQAGELADIYSVGVILHQLLTGIDPAGCMEPPCQPSGSLRLDAIWRKATHILPAQRYATVSALAYDLEKWIAAKQKMAVGASPAPLHTQRRPVVVASDGGGGFMGKLVMVGVLVALIVLGYQLLKDREPIINEVAESSAVENSGTPVPEAPPEPVPVSLPTRVEEPFPESEPEPYDTSANGEPVIEAEEDEEGSPEQQSTEGLPPGDPELQERAIGLIGEARKKRDKELADNASALHFSLTGQARDAKPHVLALMENLKEDIVDNRIPLIDGVTGLPEKMSGAFKDGLAKEESIDERYRADLTRIRDAYVTRLKGATDEASDEELKDRLLVQAGEAEDLDEWIAALSPEPEPGRVVRKSSVGLADGFAGNWDIHTEGRIERWIGHPDGKVEVVDRKWVGQWVIIEDGSLEIHWDGKKPYKLKQVSGEWIGKASFGQDVTMKRGDW